MSNQRLVFYFVENATTDGVINGVIPTSQVQLGSTFTSNTFSPLQVSNLGDDKFSLAWSENDMILTIEAAQESNPLGSSLQGQQSGE